MPALKVTVQSLAAAAAGKPALEDVDIKTIIPTTLVQVGILEGGMKSGASSLMMHFQDADKKDYYFETSLALFEGLASTVRGAAERFKK